MTADGLRRRDRRAASTPRATFDGVERARGARRPVGRARRSRSSASRIELVERHRRASTCSCCGPTRPASLAAAMMGMDASRRRGRADRDRAVGRRRGDEPDDGRRSSTAMAEAIGVPTDIAPPTTTHDRARARRPSALGDARYTARFTLAAGALVGAIVQVVPAEFARDPRGVVRRRPSARHEVLAERASADARGASPTRRSAAVERTARIAAESSAEVLTTLIGERRDRRRCPRSRRSPTTRSASSPTRCVTVEVVVRLRRERRQPVRADAASRPATLAAVMMGLDEPMGDGLSRDRAVRRVPRR